MNRNNPYTPTKGEFVYRDIVWNDYTSLDILQKVEKFQFLPNDIVVLTFPRSGTTLTQEIVWHLTNLKKISKGRRLPHIDERFPFLEFNCHSIEELMEQDLPIDLLKQQQQSNDSNQLRLIKTHCPLFMLKNNLEKSNCKIIIVMRNPKDVCTSMFHFYSGFKLFGPWSGNWNEFVNLFMDGFTKCGSWFDWNQQIIDYISNNKSNNNNHNEILFLTYEDLIINSREKIKEIAKFLSIDVNESDLEIILHNCKFDAMFQDPLLNAPSAETGFHFVRKGKIGDWKNHFTVKQSEQMDKIIEQKFNGKEIVKFIYE